MRSSNPLIILCLALALGACDDGGGAADAPNDALLADALAPDARSPDRGAPDAKVADGAAPDLGTLADNFGVEESEGAPGCEGLEPTTCLLPFPSDRYREGAGAAGGRIVFPPDVLPAHRSGTRMAEDFLAFSDGWGVATPALLQLPGADLGALPPVFEPAASLDPECATLLLDTATGERIPHWVEVDHLTRDEPVPLLILRPAVPLAFATRYVVAVRRLRDADGATWVGAPGFAALRDGTASTTVGIHARRAHFETDVFPPLAAAGFARDELALAWDFTTASAENTRAPLLAVRDAVLAALPAEGPAFELGPPTPDPHPAIRATYEGVVQIPSVLAPPSPDRLRRLRRGPEGDPIVDGTESIAFTLQLPADGDPAAPLPVMIYGHGLLGSRGEANGGYLRGMANEYGFAILAVDMQGMSEADSGIWALNLVRDASTFPAFTHAVMQGVANHLALTRLIAGGLAAVTPLDPTRVWYYGNSQGGTLGALIMAAAPDLPRGVLGVPGAAFPFLLQRSAGFAQFLTPLANSFARPEDPTLILALLGTGFSQLEPLAFAGLIEPDHRVLLHVARADATVHNQISYQLGRAVGARLMQPAVRPVFGLAPAEYPYEGSALVEFDFNKPENPDPSGPKPSEHDTHEDLRRLAAGQRQMMTFLQTGIVTATCEGACDPD